MPYPPVPANTGVQFTNTTHHDTYGAIDPVTKSNHSKNYILITGASKGVGLALAISLAKAGAAGIALGARSNLDAAENDIISAAEVAGKKPPKILKLKLDVTNWAEVQNAAKLTEKEFPRLDVLVNNAGYLSTYVPITDSDPKDYWSNYEINIKGVYLMCKAFLPQMLRGGEKTILNLSSIGAHLLAPGGSGYQTTKFALLKFTEFLMVENSDRGLLAYCVHPGGVPTALSMKLPEHAFKANIIDSPELAGDTISFLTADRRDWLAGRYISANWDMPELMRKEDEIVKGNKLKMRMVF